MSDKPACHPRKRFSTPESARAAADAIYRRDRVSLYPKRCKDCSGYHLN